ncbi:MAG: EpsG family protein [Sphingosinicella sp.]
MIPYWLLFSVFAAATLGMGQSAQDPHYRRRSQVLLAAAGVATALMIGLRHQVGGDWSPYEMMFEDMNRLDLRAAMDVTEPAYGALNYLVYSMGGGIWIVNLVCASIFTWGLIRFCRQQPHPWLALVVATPFLIIVVAMGYTRQSAALGFFLLALAAVADRALRRAVLFIALGFTFHLSIIVTLPILGLSYARKKFQSVLLAGGAAILGYFTLLAPELDYYMYGYVEVDYQAEGAIIRLTMNAIPAAIFLLNARKFDLGDDHYLWRNLSLLAVGLFVAWYFTNASVVLDRLALYLIPLQIFVLSRIPTALKGARGSSFMMSGMVVFYCAAVQFVWLNFASHAHYWIPYRMVLTAGGSEGVCVDFLGRDCW